VGRSGRPGLPFAPRRQLLPARLLWQLVRLAKASILRRQSQAALELVSLLGKGLRCFLLAERLLIEQQTVKIRQLLQAALRGLIKYAILLLTYWLRENIRSLRVRLIIYEQYKLVAYAAPSGFQVAKKFFSVVLHVSGPRYAVYHSKPCLFNCSMPLLMAAARALMAAICLPR
jgi:hypothetical protein